MTDRRNFLWTAGAAALSAVLPAGCSFTPVIDASLTKPLAVEPLPMTVGIYYPTELRHYQVTHNYSGANHHIYILGPPSIILFDHVFSGMFAGTVSLPEDPRRSGTTPDVAAVIVMEIERFQPFEITGGATQVIPVGVSIYYRFSLLSPQGRQIDSWSVGGSGLAWPSQSFIEYSFSTVAANSTAMAMREAAGKFVAGFRQRPAVANWLAGLGIVRPLPSS